MAWTNARHPWHPIIAVAVLMLLPQLLTNGAAAQEKPKIEVVPSVGHAGPVESIACSPDGALEVTGSFDHSLKLWEASSGRLIRTFQGHTESVDSVAFSHDGTRLLSGSQDRTVKLWEASSGQLIRTFQGHTDMVQSVAFSPDSTLIASASLDRTVRLWETNSGRLIRTFQGDRYFTSVAFSPDGFHLLSGSNDKTIRLWDVRDGRLIRSFPGHTGWVESVAFSPDGTRILSGGDSTVRLWDAGSGRLIRTFAGHEGLVTSVAFSPDGTRVLSRGVDGKAKYWDVNSGQLIRTISGEKQIDSIAFSAGGARLLTGDVAGTVMLWDAKSGRPVGTRAGGHAAGIFSIAVSHDGTRLLTGGWDKTVKLWEASSGRLIRTFASHSEPVTSLAFSPDGKRVLSGSRDSTMNLWETDTGRLIRTFEAKGVWVESVAFSPDGTQVLSGNWDLSGNRDDTVKLWDAESGRLVRIFEGYSKTFAISPDGTRIVGGGGRAVNLWEVSSGRLIRKFEGHSLSVRSVAFSPDGQRVLSGSDDHTVKLWDLNSGQLIRSFTGNTATVVSVAFSPDGTQVSSGGGDSAVRLWDVSSGNLVRTFEGSHSNFVRTVAYSADGTQIYSGGDDGTMSIWKIATGELIATLSAAGEGGWLAITPAGHFAASLNQVDQMVSVVRGLETYSITQFYDYLYRPDLVQENLKGDPEGRYANAKFNIDLGKILDSGPAPQIDPVGEIQRLGSAIRMTIRVTDRGGGMQKVIWRVNHNVRGDIVYFDQKKRPSAANYEIVTQTFQVDPTIRNTIDVTAYNGAGLLATEPFHREIDKFGETKQRPRMYILAVGVSDYANREWHLDYAAGDAESFGNTLKAAATGLYAEPKVVFLPDEQATIASIGATIGRLQGEIRPEDVFVMFLAGHGRSIEGRYYFLPQNLVLGHGQTIMQNGISEDLLQNWLRTISANNSVLIIDTCESAGAARGTIEADTAIDRLEHAVGRSVIAAASGPAFEGYLGHGVMSYVILQTLTQSTERRDELVSLKDLERKVKEEVPRISRNIWGVRQEPRTKTGDDFPLGQPVAMQAIQPVEPVIPKTPNAALLRDESPRTNATDEAPASRTSLKKGSQVRIVTVVGKWTLIARDGQKLGYVLQDSLLVLQ